MARYDVGHELSPDSFCAQNAASMVRYLLIIIFAFSAVAFSSDAPNKNSREILNEINIPSVKFHEASLKEFAKWVEIAARNGAPAGSGFTVKIIREGIGGLDKNALEWRKVTVDFKNLSLLGVLTLVCTDTSTQFTIAGREIQIRSQVDY